MAVSTTQPLPASSAAVPDAAEPSRAQGTALMAHNGVVQSSALLGTQQTLLIEHNGQRYRLQATRSGKLILTK